MPAKPKLTPAAVRAIRRDYRPLVRQRGNAPELARRYGVSTVTIWKIVNWHTWKKI